MLLRRFLNDARSLGALIAGFGADAASPRAAISIVALLTAPSGLVMAATGRQGRPSLNPAPVEGGRRWQATARF